MKTLKSILSFLLIGTFTTALYAQNKSLISTRWAITEADSNKIWLRTETAGFFRNAEYFNEYTKGHTLPGYIFRPLLSYQMGSKVRLNAGAHFFGIGGVDGFARVQPLFRLEYQASQSVRIVSGWLYGNLEHGVFEPMFQIDRYFYANDEWGIQFLVDNQRITSDTWINWEEYLQPGEPKQERFTFGSVNQLHLIKNSTYFIDLPIQLLATHRGGQFSGLADAPIETLANGAVGLKAGINPTSGRIKTIWGQVVAFAFSNSSPQKLTAFENGWGVYPQVGIESRLFAIETGYWHGNGFIAPRGTYLFQSVSWHNPNLAVRERNLATGKLQYKKEYKDFKFGADFHTYYDTDAATFDFAFGVFLVLNTNFLLKNTNKLQ